MNQLIENLKSHAVPSILGIWRWEIKLIKERFRFFITRKFRPFTLSNGYRVHTASQLIQAWEMVVEAGLFKHWPNGDARPVIIDIGANYGFFGHICRQRWPEAYIIGVEAHPKLASYCKTLDSGRIYNEVHNVALGESVGHVELVMSKVNGELCSGSTVADFGYSDERIKVPCATLDGLGLTADVVKIDVDGAELAVASGGSRTLNAAKHVVCECCGDERAKSFGQMLNRKPKQLTNIDYLYSV